MYYYNNNLLYYIKFNLYKERYKKLTKEEELENVLSNIKGAGKVCVMITYKNGNEVICATNIETQTNTVTEKTENIELVWWGDIVKVVVVILIIGGGVTFLALSFTGKVKVPKLNTKKIVKDGLENE